MNNLKLIKSAIEEIGIYRIKDKTGRSTTAIYKWRNKGWPRTEYTGETTYAKQFELLSNGKFKAKDLLEIRLKDSPDTEKSRGETSTIKTGSKKA